MFNRKGLSDVVSTVLIILLAVAAVSVIWFVIRPMLQNSGDEVQKGAICLSNKVEPLSCVKVVNATSFGYNVAYRASLSEEGIVLNKTNVNLIFEDGSSVTVTGVGEMNSGDSTSIAISASKNATRVQMVGEFILKSGELRQCSSEVIACSNPSRPSTIIYGGGFVSPGSSVPQTSTPLIENNPSVQMVCVQDSSEGAVSCNQFNGNQNLCESFGRHNGQCNWGHCAGTSVCGGLSYLGCRDMVPGCNWVTFGSSTCSNSNTTSTICGSQTNSSLCESFVGCDWRQNSSSSTSPPAVYSLGLLADGGCSIENNKGDILCNTSSCPAITGISSGTTIELYRGSGCSVAWGDDCSSFGVDNYCEVLMDSNKSVTLSP